MDPKLNSAYFQALPIRGRRERDSSTESRHYVQELNQDIDDGVDGLFAQDDTHRWPRSGWTPQDAKLVGGTQGANNSNYEYVTPRPNKKYRELDRGPNSSDGAVFEMPALNGLLQTLPARSKYHKHQFIEDHSASSSGNNAYLSRKSIKNGTKDMKSQYEPCSDPELQEEIPTETWSRIKHLVLEHYIQQCGSGEGSSKSSQSQHVANQQTPETQRHSSDIAESSSRKRKALASQKKGNDSTDDGDDGRQGPQQRPRIERALSDSKTWACPFFKKNPQGYPYCCDYTLRDISRVKQHLKICHLEPIHCDRCYDIFTSEDDRVEHSRQETQCELKEPVVWDAINKNQQQQLASKKRTAGSNDKAKAWYRIYRILFPNSREPDSPYLDSYESRMKDEIVAFAKSETTNIAHDLMMLGLSPSATDENLVYFVEVLMDRWASSRRLRLTTSYATPEAAIPPSSGYLIDDSATVRESELLQPAAMAPLIRTEPSVSQNFLNPTTHIGTGFSFPGSTASFASIQNENEPIPNSDTAESYGSQMWNFGINSWSSQTPYHTTGYNQVHPHEAPRTYHDQDRARLPHSTLGPTPYLIRGPTLYPIPGPTPYSTQGSTPHVAPGPTPVSTEIASTAWQNQASSERAFLPTASYPPYPTVESATRLHGQLATPRLTDNTADPTQQNGGTQAQWPQNAPLR